MILSKTRKMPVNCKRSFLKNHMKLHADNCHKRRCLFSTFNSYSFNVTGGLCNHCTGVCPWRTLRPGVEQFVWFLKNDLVRFYRILTRANLFVLNVLDKEYYSSSVSNMINSNVVYFSERSSKEVMFLLPLSVYVTLPLVLYQIHTITTNKFYTKLLDCKETTIHYFCIYFAAYCSQAIPSMNILLYPFQFELKFGIICSILSNLRHDLSLSKK